MILTLLQVFQILGFNRMVTNIKLQKFELKKKMLQIKYSIWFFIQVYAVQYQSTQNDKASGHG